MRQKRNCLEAYLPGSLPLLFIIGKGGVGRGGVKPLLNALTTLGYESQREAKSLQNTLDKSAEKGGFLGIDLTSTEAKPSACLGMDRELHLAYSDFLYQGSDILEVVNRHGFV